MNNPENKNNTDEELKQVIFNKTVELSYKALLPSFYVNIVIAAALVAVLWSTIAEGMLFGWFLFSLMVNLVRYGLYAMYFRDKNNYENTLFWDRLFYIALLLASLTLSAVTFWLTPESSSVYHYFPVMVLVGMSAGAVPALSFSMRNIITYLSLLLLPVIVNEILIATYMSYSVAVLSVALFIFSAVNAKRFNSMTIENIKLNFNSEKHKKELIESKNIAIAANSAKNTFISLISHELRTPLNAILGFSQLLQMSNEPRLNDEQDDHIQSIISSGKHLLSLIEELLDLSRVESDKLSVDIHDVSLNDALDESIILMRTAADKKQVKITTNVRHAYIIKADYKRLKQIIINLISNAIKYNKLGGEVTIEIFNPVVDRVRVLVTDTGSGLTPEQETKLFEPFMRFDEKQEGIGLGLYITKKLVNLMQGEMGVVSKVTKGTTFWFDLPLVEKI